MEKFRISGVEIHDIGPFGALKIDFPEKPAGFSDKAEIHILTGENGTGKTTVLEMLAGGLCDQAFPFDKGRHRESWFQVNLGSETSLLQDFGTTFGREKNTPEIIKRYWDSFKNLFNPYAYAGFAYSGYRKIDRENISGILELQGNPFENALNFKSSVDTKIVLQWIANTLAKEALAKNQSDSKGANKFRLAITSLEKVISNITDKNIRFLLEYDPLNVGIEVNTERLNFNQLPDGLKSIISWIADLLMRMDRVKWIDDIPVFERNFILFLDEIEVHLHPAWQRKILPAVQKLFPNAQIFISTHSPFVVGSVDGAWIHKFVKPNGDSRLAGPPMLSEDANSFRYWLAEIFDINKDFGEGSQKLLDEFYVLRDSLLVNGSPAERDRLLQIARGLSGQSPEMDSIIGWELRQINKRTNQSLAV